MILIWLIIIPLIGGLAAWFLGNRNAILARWISLAALALDVVLLISFWPNNAIQLDLTHGAWLIEINKPWIPQLGISLHLAMDGLSLVLVALTLFLGIISVICSWTEIRERVGFFHMNLLWILAGILGVFMAAGPVPVLLLLGADAHPDVLPDQHLGAREPRLRIAQVLHLYPGGRPADAPFDPGTLFHPRPGHGRLYIRLHAAAQYRHVFPGCVLDHARVCHRLYRKAAGRPVPSLAA